MSLRSRYSAGTLQNSYNSSVPTNNSHGVIQEEPQVHVQSASYGRESRPHTLGRAFTYTTLSQSPRIYPAKKTGAPPPLPPKGIKSGSDSKHRSAHSAQSTTRTGQWVLAMSQESQTDYAAGGMSQSQEGGNMEGFGYSYETISEQSLSDSTQASGISEPIFKRSRYVIEK